MTETGRNEIDYSDLGNIIKIKAAGGRGYPRPSIAS